ncbi:MAG: hypothetical protein O7E52_09380 [Candidatus Poribacteria bacterium]|nr:hypothetical protein [Candidatus Poribacteria bacterium]
MNAEPVPVTYDSGENNYAKLFTELKSNAEEGMPNFHSRPLRTLYTEMPADFNVEDFIAGW